MATTQELKHRTTGEQQEQAAKEASDTDMNKKQQQRPMTSAMARRGFRSLAVAVTVPVLLDVLDIYLFGSSQRYRTVKKPFYFPPLWTVHLACLVKSLLSGLAAWMFWADGGFHKKPMALGLFLAQLGFGLGWFPAVFGAGLTRVGLAMWAGLVGALVGCIKVFRTVNPISSDLLKPCLVPAVLVGLVNYRLM